MKKLEALVLRKLKNKERQNTAQKIKEGREWIGSIIFTVAN